MSYELWGKWVIDPECGLCDEEIVARFSSIEKAEAYVASCLVEKASYEKYGKLLSGSTWFYIEKTNIPIDPE